MAREFSGSGQYARVADPGSGDLDFGTSAFTIAGWVWCDDYGGSENIIVRKDPGGGSRGLYLFRVSQTTGLLEFQVGNTTSFPSNFTTITGSTAVGTGAWFHAACVRDRTADVIRIYLNGVSDATAVTDKDGNCDNSGSFSIGGWYDDGVGGLNGSPLDGRLAEIGVWARALSSSEIASLADGFSPLYYPASIRMYLPLIGNNSPETDYIKGNNLTVTGATKIAHPRIIYPSNTQIFGFSGGTDVTTSPSAQTATVSLPSPTVAAVKNVTTTPDVQSLTASQPSPTVTAVRNVTVSPNVQSLTTSQPSIGIAVGDGATPAVQDLTVSLPSPTVTTTRNVTVSPNPQSLTTSLPTPTVDAGGNVTVSPSVQGLSVSIPDPTISTIKNISVAVDPVTLSVALPTLSVEAIDTTWNDTTVSTTTYSDSSISTSLWTDTEVEETTWTA